MRRWGGVVLLVAVAGEAAPAAGTPRFVQQSAVANGPGTTSPVTLADAGLPGDLLILAITYDAPTLSVLSVADSEGDAWSRILGPTDWGGGLRSELWYAPGVDGGAPVTTTASLNGDAGTFVLLDLSEYSGVDPIAPLDQFAVDSGVSAGVFVTSGSRNTHADGELVFGRGEGGFGPVVMAGSGFTTRTTNRGNVDEDRIAAIGPSSADFVLSAPGTYLATMATFRAALAVDAGGNSASDSGAPDAGVDGTLPSRPPLLMWVGCGCAQGQSGSGAAAWFPLFSAALGWFGARQRSRRLARGGSPCREARMAK